MRDYIHSPGEGTKPTHQALADCYNRLFPDLRDQIEKFPGFRLKWQPFHYNTPKENHDGLFNNLRNTEIDIVLETPTRLFIGEAKDESTLGANGKSVLVHQLIRQYVMTTILVELVPLPPEGIKKEVIPFVVGDVESYQQVKFMIEQRKHDRDPGGWLKEENILSWHCIKRIAESTAAAS